MASQRDIKRRISSVQNTKKITKAMEMVAAARLRKAQMRIEGTRPYALRMMEFIAGLAPYVNVDEAQFPLLQKHEEIKRVALVSLTADRGLSGAFNSNIIRRTLELYRQYRSEGIEIELLAIGKKGVGTYRFQGYALGSTWTGITDNPTFIDAQAIAHRVGKLYAEGEVDRVHLIYNQFKTAMEQFVTDLVLLPIQEEIVQTYLPENAAKNVEFLFEPTAEEILNDLLPAFLEGTLYRALLESTASEHGARMTAMRNASEAAGEMIDSLTLAMNRARQASITREILEVVAGADALA